MSKPMTQIEKLNAISQIPYVRATFRKLPKEHRVRVIEGLDEVTVANLKASIEKVNKGN